MRNLRFEKEVLKQAAIAETNIDQSKTNDFQEPQKLWNAVFINIVIVNVIMNLGQFMMNTLIPKFADSLGATATVVGLVTSVFTITALAAKSVSGPAIDSLPKKKILFGATLIIILAFIIYSLAHSVATIIVARLIHGIGLAFTASTCLAIACDALPRDKMAQGIGYFSLGQAIASAVGPAVGLSLATRFGYNKMFAIGAGVMALSAVLAITMKTPSTHTYKKFKISLENMFAKEAVIPAMLQLFLAMSYTSIGSFLVLYAQNERGVENIGLWFTVNAVCMIITRPVVGKLADKYGIHKVLLPAIIMFALSLFVISISDNIYLFLLSAAVNAFGYGTIVPTNQALCMKCVTPERRGVGGNTNYIGMDLGFMTGPVLAGVFVSNFGYSNMYKLMIIPIVIACALFIYFYSKIKEICIK